MRDAGPRWAKVLVGLLQVGLTVAMLWALSALFGVENMVSALRDLPWWTYAVALVLGGAGVVTQAARWRIVARSHAIEVGALSAVARCWQAAFLNSVLPGGLVGDVLRASDDSTDASVLTRRRALASGFAAMAAERLVGSAVIFAAAGAALLARAPLAGIGCLMVAALAAGIASRWLRALTVRDVVHMVLLSIGGWCCFAGLFTVAAAVLASEAPPSTLPGSAAIAVAGMSVPVGVGGWGIREAAAGWSFLLAGLPAEAGVRVSVGYGALALTSTTPGAVVLALRAAPRLRHIRRFLARTGSATSSSTGTGTRR